jgi:hypothetical protein
MGGVFCGLMQVQVGNQQNQRLASCCTAGDSWRMCPHSTRRRRVARVNVGKPPYNGLVIDGWTQ